MSSVVLVFSDGSRIELNTPGRRLMSLSANGTEMQLFPGMPQVFPRGNTLRILLDQPIEMLGVSVRATNALFNAGYRKIGSLCISDEKSLLKAKGVDRRVITEVDAALYEMRLTRGMTEEDTEGWKPHRGDVL